jgi:hypothetical protein
MHASSQDALQFLDGSLNVRVGLDLLDGLSLAGFGGFLDEAFDLADGESFRGCALCELELKLWSGQSEKRARVAHGKAVLREKYLDIAR